MTETTVHLVPAPVPTATVQEQPSKSQAVRNAMKALGKDVSIQDYVDWIKANYGIEMTNQHVSQTKSLENKRGGKKPGKRGRKAGQVNAAPAAVAAPIATVAAAVVNSADPVSSIDTTLSCVNDFRSLERKYGADMVRKVASSVLA